MAPLFQEIQNGQTMGFNLEKGQTRREIILNLFKEELVQFSVAKDALPKEKLECREKKRAFLI
jgi:hypothetical protein